MTLDIFNSITDKSNSVSKFIIPHLHEAQHVSGDTPPIQQPHVQQPSTYAKSEAASAVLGS
jgi:hypothetical protein